jgi:hypothetical protein
VSTTYLFALGAISTTFVGFSALILVFRQTVGGGLSKLDSWIALVFVQLGFIVTAGSLAPPLMLLCGAPPVLTWRLTSVGAGLVMGAFAITYPFRRYAASGVRMPLYVWIDLGLLALSTLVLVANAAGYPFAPNAGAFSVGLTGVLFVSGLGFLHALGALHREDRLAERH